MPDLAATLSRLHDILPENAGLTLADKRTLVGQAKVLIEQVYALLHLKKALYGIDPVQRLTLLQYRLENPADEVVTQELEFHRELLAIFTSLHDLHTNYILPTPYRSITAVLPFLVEEYFDEQQQAHYLLTRVTPGLSQGEFKPGVEILQWNGLPIVEAIRQLGEQCGGSNAAARYAVGLRSLTVRPLAVSLPPVESNILIHYRTEDGKERDTTFEWLVMQPSRPTGDSDTGAGTPRAPDTLLPVMPSPVNLYRDFLLGNHFQGDCINECRKRLFAPSVWEAERHVDSGDHAVSGEEIATSLVGTLKALSVDTPDGTFAYLRLFSFMVQDDQQFLDEVIRLLDKLPQGG
ncbi:MAG: hypothetical protein R3E89_05590 [Thiolinea sp.]